MFVYFFLFSAAVVYIFFCLNRLPSVVYKHVRITARHRWEE